MLAVKSLLTTLFIVINADDYYGKEGFRVVHEYLVNGGQSCMVGFVLKKEIFNNQREKYIIIKMILIQCCELH